jgi:hypothetical protein
VLGFVELSAFLPTLWPINASAQGCEPGLHKIAEHGGLIRFEARVGIGARSSGFQRLLTEGAAPRESKVPYKYSTRHSLRKYWRYSMTVLLMRVDPAGMVMSKN